MYQVISAVKPTAHKTPFQTAHIIEYGLTVVERDSETQNVLGVRCQFCMYFGHEELVGQLPTEHKCKQTAKLKDWHPPFRSEHYRDHHKGQHSAWWENYQLLSYDEKRVYFNEKTQYNRNFG